MLRRCLFPLASLAALLLAACDGEQVNYDSARYDAVWQRLGGSDTVAEAGVYGTLGVTDPASHPGARTGAVSWTDNAGHFWLFGGTGYDSSGTLGHLNDLWVYDGTSWTWVKGSAVAESPATYGTQGVADALNTPGARGLATGWKDAAGNLWLFGGSGLDVTATQGRLDDLWKFDGTAWTWVAGDNTADQAGTYGTQGTADPANHPGGRYAATGWVGDDGSFWLFGGTGFAATATDCCWLNDLWKYNGTAWTWVKGSSTANAPAVYVTAAAVADDPNTPVNEAKAAVTAADLTPGGRYGAASWHIADPTPADAVHSETAWIFGGIGDGNGGAYTVFNEMWSFDGTNWVFVAGTKGDYSPGSYGGRNVFALTNQPPSRSFPTVWGDGATLWMFGGSVETSSTTLAYPNDLWRFEGLGWTWVGGSSDPTTTSAGTYPTLLGTGQPAGREGGVGWIDSLGDLWLFGGSRRDDLWKLKR